MEKKGAAVLRRAGPLPSVAPPVCWDCGTALDKMYAAYRKLRHEGMSAKDALDHPSVGLRVAVRDGFSQRVCCRDKILCNGDLSWTHTLYRDIAAWAEGTTPTIPPTAASAPMALS